MSIKHKSLGVIAGLVLATNVAVADPLSDAKQAFFTGDYAKAFPAMEALAKQNIEAQYWVAVMYARGQGVEKNSEKAVEMWSKVAAKGNVDAQQAMAESYATGVGIKQSMPKAVQWATKTAEQDNANGQYLLGGFYEKGMGGLKVNKVEAYKWYSLAASHPNGFQAATDTMTSLEKGMQPADVASAKKKADQWVAKHRKSAAKSSEHHKTSAKK